MERSSQNNCVDDLQNHLSQDTVNELLLSSPINRTFSLESASQTDQQP